MRKLRKKTAALLKDRKGNMMPLVVAVTICMLIIILGVAEYMRLVITAAGIKDHGLGIPRKRHSKKRCAFFMQKFACNSR